MYGRQTEKKEDADAIIVAFLESLLSIVCKSTVVNNISSESNLIDPNIFTFTLDNDEESSIEELQSVIEQHIKENLLTQTDTNKREIKYLLDFLEKHGFDRDKQKFTQDFNPGFINGFVNDLNKTRDSIDAFRSAWSGEKEKVQKYVSNYPHAKNDYGPWGTTLLFTAARNNCMKLVTFLVEEAKCSVDAQNQQDLARVLKDHTSKDTGDRNPSAGSTALHAACYYGHLEIVKYLLQQGADCYLTNHNFETPMDNAVNHSKIIEFFKTHLVLSYYAARTISNLPHEPIPEENEMITRDCVWEYKPLSDNKWYSFSATEADEFHKNMLVGDDDKYQHEIRLLVNRGLYVVNMFDFIRSANDQTYNEKSAWIRCRGSSMLNFSCFPLWQMMFTKYPNSTTEESRKMETIPAVIGHHFQIRLCSWYFCGPKTADSLEKKIRYRQRLYETKISELQTDIVTFDMSAFTFKNDSGTIEGHIRWIPQMVAYDSHKKQKLVSVDEYHSISTMNALPLTVKRSQQLKKTELHTSITDDTDHLLEPESDENNGVKVSNMAPSNVEMMAMTQETIERINTTSTVADILMEQKIIKEDDPLIANIPPSSTTITSKDWFDTEPREAVNNIIPDAKDLPKRIEKLEKLEEKGHSLPDDDTIRKHIQQEFEDLTDKYRKLEESLEKKNKKLNQLLGEEDINEKLIAKLREQILEVQNEKRIEEESCRKFRALAKRVRCHYHSDIENIVAERFIAPNQASIISRLKEKIPDLDERLADRIPQISMQMENNRYKITVVGLPEHHNFFKQILIRILKFLSLVDHSKKSLDGNVRRTLENIVKGVLPRVKSKSGKWFQYQSIYKRFLAEKEEECRKKSHEFWEEQLVMMRHEIIDTDTSKLETIVKNAENQYKLKNNFVIELNQARQQALEEFIKQNVLIQQLPNGIKPTNKSVSLLHCFINEVREEFFNKSIYKGSKLENFQGIPKLLQRLLLYYRAFLTQLPLFESAKELLTIVEKNIVTTISTSTGSGKSTLLPLLLVADGYDKIIVTQPRRLPCQLICRRVNEIGSDVQGNKDPLAGWAVSGNERNPNAQILLLTDGLLKDRLLYDRNLITSKTSVNKSVVIFIDEVHERSVNIDLCLGLLARKLELDPQLHTKLKVIISSATLDESVPNLFKKILKEKVTKFEMPKMGTLYPVKKIHRPRENAIDVVRELCKSRRRHEQILCFVSSVTEVNENCRLLNQISQGTLVAYPLVQSQHPNVQQENIEHGTIFFSTTIAETSLTFPCLKYVVDTGMINIPVYDPDNKKVELKEVRAAASTIKQRLGRLGRTQTGEYYSLYDFNVDSQPYPEPHIRQSDLSNIEFSLRRSPIGRGFSEMNKYLPNPPSPRFINAALAEMQSLGIVKESDPNQLTTLGRDLAKLPDFGSLTMAKAVHAGLNTYHCGHDMVCLASILGVLNTTNIFKDIPSSMKSVDGDYMSLIKIMKTVLNARRGVAPSQFNLERVCQATGLVKIQHIIKQALRRYTTLEKIFITSDLKDAVTPNPKESWEAVARSLYFGYPEHVFVSMKELQERVHYFVQYKRQEIIAKLDLSSTITRDISKAPIALVLAKDIRYSTSIRGLAIISFLGSLEPSWLGMNMERIIKLTKEEEQHLKNNGGYNNAESIFGTSLTMQLKTTEIHLKGSFYRIFEAELYILYQLVTEMKFNLDDLVPGGRSENFGRNLEEILKMRKIFTPMIWRWSSENQVEININSNFSTKKCEITLKGRMSHNQRVKAEFESFIKWLKPCIVFRHPESGLDPRVFTRKARPLYRDIEQRIARVTDPDRSPIDVYNAAQGSGATRETRMEVVAWVAICKHDCKLEGGFVRDWIVGNFVDGHPPPNSPITDWIETRTPVPAISKKVVPSDLDCHLPSDKLFDVNKFQDNLYKFGIQCTVHRQEWRYVLLFDESAPTGPFTMDLIEPHVALTHDRIDFDVSNLSVEKGYTHEIGMRIDIQRQPYDISLEKIVENIKKKRFQLLRPDDSFTEDRVSKMINIRGWTQIKPDLNVLPSPHPQKHYILAPLPSSSTLYKYICSEMQNIAPYVRIHSIDEISNPYLEETYNGLKKIIAKQCSASNPNEKLLFHGTKMETHQAIIEDGYDDRFFSTGGLYGHGAYFADDPKKSHAYAHADQNTGQRVMFYNKVLLGISMTLTAEDKSLVSAPKGFHSVIGKHAAFTEYIVYRFGQAIPYLKIIYSA